MTAATTAYAPPPDTTPVRRALLPAGWPLTGLFALFPLWWVLGLGHFIFFIFAAIMAYDLLRRRPVLAPVAFGFWLLFLLAIAAGAALLWVHPPGTVEVHGIARLVPYAYHVAWYLSITIVALYVLNLPERELSNVRVMRLLALMFLYTVGGGFAGILLPNVDFPSALEILLPIPRQGFINTLVHPSLVSASEFLGYDQPRPSAPFSFPNAWGNNLGTFLPFFVGTWFARDAGWRRPAGVVVLVLAIVPVAFSLNRGLWLGLLLALVLLIIKLATMGRTRILQFIAAGLVVGAVGFAASPLYDTVSLRLSTPHSDERRGTVASEVIRKTAGSSPLLGYGETRAVSGSFESIAGGETPDCHQCAAPPLGTQGFMWRLIFTTGLVGTLLFLGFMASQLFTFAPMKDTVAIVGCVVIAVSLLYSFVYDSLESPLFTVMIAIGLMNRRFVRPSQLAPRWSSRSAR